MNRKFTATGKYYRSVFDATPSIAYIIDPGSGEIVDANAAAVQFWGYTRKELSAMKMADISQASPDVFHERVNHVLSNTQQCFEIRQRLKSGELRDVEVYSSQLIYRNRSFICSIAHDITDRKRAEEALRQAYDALEETIQERTFGLVAANARLNTEIAERIQAQEALQQSEELLRELVEHQERIREDERKRIAREIHDELGQHLLVLRIDVSLLKNRKDSAHPKLEEKVDVILQHIDSTMRSVRAIINNLRPAVLDLGLIAALEWQAKDFQRRNKIACELISQDENLELDDDRSTVLFRLLQEALTNVVRHAKATKVIIDLYRENGSLVLKVADNGIGMPKVRNRKAKSFGLAGIRERIGMLGGDFAIDTDSDGTRLTFSIPL